ncbi:Gmad2 immunoglobulin-like domain-containing protein [Paenactinomyces guangxiensis]|uniref:Bacterial spore germination immunoglobulin-like domain-containing protein n=1 Tax=Paenactinomyces guangxiensis TaxID=1490290 RepID=A0A7W2A6T3_9BACL|nr:Gmad2 immunoglobulin-like domain-containing protein [Paenactinomyces guangxiensis]MBA4492860.1 hypothetical protein [Paenactinomyces guangxiensis]MBH8590291.1 hypothetical protein [Paenactinomyces guangxiensis]
MVRHLFISLLALFLIGGCNPPSPHAAPEPKAPQAQPEEQTVQKQQSPADHQQHNQHPQAEETGKSGNEKKPADNSKRDSKKSYQNKSFRHVKATRSTNDTYTVTGKARAWGANIYYVVTDGSKQVLDEQTVHLKSAPPSWSAFEFSFYIPKSERKNKLFLKLYEKSAKDGSSANVLQVPLQE